MLLYTIKIAQKSLLDFWNRGFWHKLIEVGLERGSQLRLSKVLNSLRGADRGRLLKVIHLGLRPLQISFFQFLGLIWYHIR